MINEKMMTVSPRAILTGTFLIFLGPFLLVELFPAQLDMTIDKGTYIAFHNIIEFFSIAVSFLVFSVGWSPYDQSKDRHALFLGIAFLAVGLLDFMHTMSNAAMPGFITPNSTNKSTQFWIAARLLESSAFFISAFVYPMTQSKWLSKAPLMAAALTLTGLVFISVTFFPAYLPATAIQGVGLTPLKRYLEFVVIFLLIGAGTAYWRRMEKTGDRLILYYLSAFIICGFSEGIFASYTTGFDTFNVLGHIYKVAAFYLLYKGLFGASIMTPYSKLIDADKENKLLNKQLEQRVLERTAQLRAANKELEAFSYSVSHDLHAPLRAIDGFSQLLLDRYHVLLDESGGDYLQRIRNATHKMSQLIDDLLKFSRFTNGELNKTAVDLSLLAGEVAGELKRSQTGRRVTFLITEGLVAQCDQHLLKVALENLLGNAWKFTSKKEEATIEFGSTLVDGAQTYFVRDNGAGFDMAFSNRLFGAFQRLHQDREFPGTGVGLSLVQRIIHRHGGKIWAEGKVGGGATFYFTLCPKSIIQDIQIERESALSC